MILSFFVLQRTNRTDVVESVKRYFCTKMGQNRKNGRKMIVSSFRGAGPGPELDRKVAVSLERRNGPETVPEMRPIFTCFHRRPGGWIQSMERQRERHRLLSFYIVIDFLNIRGSGEKKDDSIKKKKKE